MATGTKLLNDDGSASMATLLMMSHHAFRRDLGRFQAALARVKAGDATRVEALQNEWKGYHMALHGHHMQEDGAIFPDLREKHPALRGVLDQLASDHRRIDPLLEGEYGYNDLYMGVPVVIGAGGVERIVQIDLTAEEKGMLAKSAESVQKVRDLVKSKA